MHPGYRLAIEPGRYLVAEAGVLLANITQIIKKNNVQRVGLDAGINTLIHPTLYDAWHDIENLSQLNTPTNNTFNIVKPIYESSDIFNKHRRLPAATMPGDVVLVADTGTYDYSMTNTYNQRELPHKKIINAPAG